MPTPGAGRKGKGGGALLTSRTRCRATRIHHATRTTLCIVVQVDDARASSPLVTPRTPCPTQTTRVWCDISTTIVATLNSSAHPLAVVIDANGPHRRRPPKPSTQGVQRPPRGGGGSYRSVPSLQGGGGTGRHEFGSAHAAPETCRKFCKSCRRSWGAAVLVLLGCMSGRGGDFEIRRVGSGSRKSALWPESGPRTPNVVQIRAPTFESKSG